MRLYRIRRDTDKQEATNVTLRGKNEMDVLATSWYRKAGGLILIFAGRDPGPPVTSFPTLGHLPGQAINLPTHQQRTTNFICYTYCEQTLV